MAMAKGMDMDRNELTGRGMKFPPQIDEATGRFKTSTGAERIKESIYLILMTQKTERWIRPEYGSNIMNYTFLDTNSTMLNLMSMEITRDLTMNEPRIKNVEVGIDAASKEGYLLVSIDYTIREDNTRDNLVFPFYLNLEHDEM
jgi:phage baseplate assembly protein W